MDTAKQAETAHSHRILRNAISSLPAMERFVIENRYFNHKTCTKIARLIERSEARVCQIDKDARKRLNGYLAEMGLAEG